MMTILKQEFGNETILFMTTWFNYPKHSASTCNRSPAEESNSLSHAGPSLTHLLVVGNKCEKGQEGYFRANFYRLEFLL